MARAKRTSKQKRRRRAFPALGAAFGRGGRRIGNRVYSECTAARYRTPPRHYAR